MKKIFCSLLVFMYIIAVFPQGIGGWNVPAMAAEMKIVQLAAGENYSLALLSDGSLYAWGDNTYGQLGDGTNTNRSIPIRIGSGYTAIAAGARHSLALKGNALYTWGHNDLGSLGDGSNANRNAPVQIGIGYTAIAAGSYHSLALKGNTLYAWGNNIDGQLGDATFINRNTPVQVGTGYTAIACGFSHSLALKGTALYAWGYNYFGQLGNGTNTDKNAPAQIGTGYTAIAAGDFHSLALKGNTLCAWGFNSYGQLGNGVYTAVNTPAQIGIGFSAISAGAEFSLALKENALYAWGRNDKGQLGDGAKTKRNTPAQIGTGYTAIAAGSVSAHSLALKGDALYAWGNNSDSQLGDGTNTDKNTPARIAFFTDLINPPPVSDTYLNISKHDLTLKKGTSETLKATLIPGGEPVSVTWKSSNSKIAKVSNSGVVTAAAPGTAVISIETNGYYGRIDKTGRSHECFVTVQGGSKDAKPLGTSDWIYFYGKTKLTAPTSNLKDALAKVKKSIGGYSYSENADYGSWSYEGLKFGSTAAGKTHTNIYVQVTDKGDYFSYGYVGEGSNSPIKTNRGIVIGSKKSAVQQKYGLPTYTSLFTYGGKVYESFTYQAKTAGKGLYTTLSFQFLKSKGTVSIIAFSLGEDYLEE